MRLNTLSRLDTDTTFLKNLIDDIKKGEVKIPQFQRKFVWKEQQALELLDSIVNNYPIGSLLLWKTQSKLATERNIGDFKLPATDDLTPTDYVLDGQQRITVIYSCLGAPDNERGFAVAYDLDKDAFVLMPEEHNAKMFPMRWLYETTKMLNFRTGLQSYPRGDEYQATLDALISAFTNYKIPVVTLKQLSLEEVCPIFERINSSGTKLSMYDLMVAATWSQAFDLNEEAAKITSALGPKGFGNVDPNTILKCLAAVHFGSIKKADIVALRSIDVATMDALVERTRKALLRAVDLLSTEFKIYSWEFLPYEAFAVVLCFIFSRVSTLSPEKLVRVRQWFWRASFNERYRVGGESFVTRDLEFIQKFVIDESGDSTLFGMAPSPRQLVSAAFRSNNSRARAFILALAMRGPKNLTNGATIDTADALSSYNRKQFHHIYPRAHLKRIEDPEGDNTIINICMLAASENNAVSDRDPNEYLPECIVRLGSDVASVFRSNLMPDPANFEYATASYSHFLHTRSGLVATYIATLCEGEVH
jgi:hypothetical protein